MFTKTGSNLLHYGIVCLLIFLQSGTISAESGDEQLDPQVFELSAFVVYGGIIDTIDGFTGEDYHRSNQVVEEFRQDFNTLLRGYHKKLLIDEYAHMQDQLQTAKRYEEELKNLTEGFGIRGFSINHDSYLRIEKSIMNRLIKDPFFRIEALVVWDLDQLKGFEKNKPDSRYSADIRYNPQTESWERRITTTWRVSYHHNRTGNVDVIKEQGLNLDTQKGYHFINRGLGNEVPSSAFRPVNLTYPIFVNSKEPIDSQLNRLRDNFIATLYHIYDPFSWAWRRNVRFHKGFIWPIQASVRSTRFKVKDSEWFEEVMIHFLDDIATIRVKGVDVIYEQEMLTKVPVNNNILGIGFDLLNWNEGENRSVQYNPSINAKVNINFSNPNGARFIMIDAYRRFPDQFVVALQNKLANQQKITKTGQELIKEVLSELTGVSADLYIRKAAEAQMAELEKYRIQL